MAERRVHGIQGLLAYITLALVLLSVLILGGHSPIAWSLLSISVFLIFSVQVALAWVSPVPLAVERLVVPGLLVLAVAAWGWIQTLGGVPPAYAHPLWATVPDAPASLSADPGQGRHAVMRLLCYAMVFVIIVWASADARRASRLLKAIAVFSALLAGYGLFAWDSGENLFLGEAAWSSGVTATFVNRNNYATYAGFGALANLAAYLHVTERQGDDARGRIETFFTRGWIYAFGFLVCIGAVTLTQSRAGGVAAVIGLATFLLAWRRDRAGRWEALMLMPLLAMIVFVAVTSARGLAGRLLATSGEDARFAVYPAVVDAIADRPLLGHGLGTFEEAFRPYVPAEAAGAEWAFAHNTFLELAFGLGLPATGVFLAALALILWRIFRGARTRRRERVYTCLALGCAAAATFHSLLDFSLQIPAVAALFAAILAVGYAQSFTYEELGTSRERGATPRERAPRAGPIAGEGAGSAGP